MPNFAYPILIADIGGTNARFQIVRDASGTLEEVPSVRTADFATIEDAVRKNVLDKGHQPRTAILAAAGPITLHGLNLTNCDWNIEPDKFLETLDIDRLILFNDFDAQALALPFLTADDVQSIGDVQLSPIERTKAVIGPGTGLGVGTLARAGGHWVPVGGEGGHVDLGPRTDREAEIWPHLETIGGRISAEQVLSGDGLVNLYCAVCKADKEPIKHKTAADVSSAGLGDRDHLAQETLEIFCACLGRLAGDLALSVMAKGGVFIGGGIASHIAPALTSGHLRVSFDDKAPHNDLMKSIGLHIITHPLPALLGLARYAYETDQFAIDLSHRSWQRC